MDDLSKERENDQGSPGMLLGPQERLICEQIAAGGPPHSKRAQSLLAVNAGVTQKIAAQQSGLTVGQVSYWLGKFRRDGMSIFPEELMLQIEPEPPLEKKAKTKKKSKKVKASKKAKKGKKSAVQEAKPGKKAKTKKKSKKVKASKKAKKGKKNGKKKQAKKPKKQKKKSDKKK